MYGVRRGCVIFLVLVALNAPSANAALPNWSGEWEVVGIKEGASGVLETPIPDIMRKFGGHPPYTPEAEAKFQAYLRGLPPYAARQARDVCIWGFPTIMLESPSYFEVLITPQETAMIFSGREVRHIYTDGRAQPPADELWPTPWGSSVGHWEGQTLV